MKLFFNQAFTVVILLFYCMAAQSEEINYAGHWVDSGGRDYDNKNNPKYKFTVVKGGRVVIDLTSIQDTYLYLLDDKGNEVEKDDDGGYSRNSKINLELGAGVYTVVAASYYENRSGNFNLKVVGEVASRTSNIKFYAIADPQFDFHTNSGWEIIAGGDQRARDGMKTVAFIAKECNDCVKMIPIAGDLTHDGGGLGRYARAVKKMRSYGVKVFDGLGNHDITNYDDDVVSFNSLAELKRGEDLLGKGWEIKDYYADYIDAGREYGDCSSFNPRGDYYCKNKDAFYYTVSLAEPGTGVISAYLVQLHNKINSLGARNYLSRILNDSSIDKTLPIIIIVHQFGSSSYELADIVKKLNVAAIIMGHENCTGTSHCDYKSALKDTADRHHKLKNIHGSLIPTFNVNSIFNNIFWAFSLDSVNEEVSFKRYNMAEYNNVYKDKLHNTYMGFSYGGNSLKSEFKGGFNKQIDNFPWNWYTPAPMMRGDLQTCSYTVPDQTCFKQSQTKKVEITAAHAWNRSDKSYFFSNDKSFVRYDSRNETTDSGYPRKIREKYFSGLELYKDEIAAAFRHYNYIYYFLINGNYLKFDIRADKVLNGYPKSTARYWRGIGDDAKNITAAIKFTNDKVYFFTENGRYLRYSMNTRSTGPVLSTAEDWPGLIGHENDIVGALHLNEDEAYFFLKDDSYIPYNIKTNTFERLSRTSTDWNGVIMMKRK